MSIFLAGAGLCWSAAVAGEVSSTDSTLKAKQGKEYRRIISFSPGVTEIIYKLGGQDRLAGIASFSDYPPQAMKEKPTVGGILNIDSEKVLSLAPDLIISPPGAMADEQLPKFGADIAYLPDKTLADVAAEFEEIGRLVGKADEGRALAESLRSEVTKARQRNAVSPPIRALVVIGYEPLWVAGGDGVVNELLTAAGGTNVTGGVKKDFYQADLEAVLAAQPEVIIDLTLDSPATNPGRETVISFWKRFPSLPAVRDGHIYFIDSDLLTIPGPRLVEGLGELEKTLRKVSMERKKPEAATNLGGGANAR